MASPNVYVVLGGQPPIPHGLSSDGHEAMGEVDVGSRIDFTEQTIVERDHRGLEQEPSGADNQLHNAPPDVVLSAMGTYAIKEAYA